MRARLRRLGSSISIEIVAGLVVACIVFVGGWVSGLIWTALFACSGDITTHVRQGEAYLMAGQLSDAEPIVVQAIKDAPQCECVRHLATEYYRLVMVAALREHQMDKALVASRACVEHASKKGFFGSIPPRRGAASAFCVSEIEKASRRPDQPRGEKAAGKVVQQNRGAVPTLDGMIDRLEREGVPNVSGGEAPTPETHSELGEAEPAPAPEKRGKGVDALESEDACKTPPTKSREKPVTGCPGAPSVA